MAEKPKRLRLVCDVLDTLLVDRRGQPMGRADGIVILVDGDSQPRVAWIETGGAVLAKRVGPRFSRIFRAVVRRIGISRRQRFRIAWEHVKSVGVEMKLDLDAKRAPTLAWEKWIARRIFARIPGGKARE